MNESCPKYEWVTPFIQMTHTDVDESWCVTFHLRPHHASCATHECVMSHIWMSHDSYPTYEWVMSHIWMSHDTHMNESYYTYEWLTPHIQTTRAGDDDSWCVTSHIRPNHVSCLTYEWVMSQIWMSHAPHTNDTYRRWSLMVRHFPSSS